MDNDSRTANTNRRNGKKKGGFAAPPPNDGTDPTTVENATEKEKRIEKAALGKAKNMVDALPQELQQKILTTSQ